LKVRREDLKRGLIIEVRGYSEPVYFYKIDVRGYCQIGAGNPPQIQYCYLKDITRVLAEVVWCTGWEVEHGIRETMV